MPLDRQRQRARVWRPRDVDVDVEADASVEGARSGLRKIRGSCCLMTCGIARFRSIEDRESRRALDSRTAARASLEEPVEHLRFTLKMVTRLKGLDYW